MYTSTTLVKPSNEEFHTCSRIMVRVTGRLTFRTKYSSSRNSFGRRSISLPNLAALRRIKSSSRSPERSLFAVFDGRSEAARRSRMERPRRTANSDAKNGSVRTHLRRRQTSSSAAADRGHGAKMNKDAPEFSCRSCFTRSKSLGKGKRIRIDENTVVQREPEFAHPAWPTSLT